MRLLTMQVLAGHTRLYFLPLRNKSTGHPNLKHLTLLVLKCC